MNSAAVSPAQKKSRRQQDDGGCSSSNNSILDRTTLGEFTVRRKDLVTTATGIAPFVRNGSMVDQTRQPLAPLDRDWLSESLLQNEELDYIDYATKPSIIPTDSATTTEPPQQPPLYTASSSSSSNNSSSNNNNDNHLSLKVVTWNIWFSSHFWRERLVAAISETLACCPDVVCFQEVTKAVHNSMLRCSYLRERYEPTEEMLPHGYDASVWVKKMLPPSSLRYRCWSIPLESSYGRRGLCVDLELVGVVCGREIVTKRARVVTVHLESNRNKALTRERQLHRLFSCIRSTPWNGSTRSNDEPAAADLSILAGDFNIDPTYHENALVRSNGIDLWEVLRPDEIGYTMNSYKNKMMFYAYCKPKQARYDRIVLVPERGSKAGARPVGIRVLGDEPFDRKRNLWASDHSGLVAEFEFELYGALVDVEEYRVQRIPPEPSDGYTTP